MGGRSVQMKNKIIYISKGAFLYKTAYLNIESEYFEIINKNKSIKFPYHEILSLSVMIPVLRNGVFIECSTKNNQVFMTSYVLNLGRLAIGHIHKTHQIFEDIKTKYENRTNPMHPTPLPRGR